MINALTAERPPGRSPLNIAGRVVGGLVVAGLGLIQGLFWLLVAGFRCDESCDDAPTSWHGTSVGPSNVIAWTAAARRVASGKVGRPLGDRSAMRTHLSSGAP